MRRDLRTAAVVARVEAVATARRLLGDRRQLLAVFLGFGQFVLWPLFFVGQITDLAAQAAAGDPPIGLVGGVVGGAVLMGGFVGGASAINRNRVGNVGPLLRSSVPPRAVAVGRLLSELGQTAALGAPVAVVLGGLLALGSGGPVVPTLTAVVVLLPAVAAVLVGRAIGSAVRYAGLLSGLGVWTKVTAFLLFMTGLFVATQVAVASLFEDAPFGFEVPVGLPTRLVSDYTATVFTPLGTTPTPAGVAVIAASLAAVPVGLVVVARYETLILLEDEGTGPTETTETGSGRIPRPFTRSRATRVAWRQLRRSKRDPRSLAHLFAFVAGPAAAAGYLAAEPEQATRIAGPGLVVFGSLLAGAMYCLNPMGDDREQLPWLLTSLASTAVLLRGRMYAGAAVGGLLALVGVAATAVWLSPAVAAGLLVASPILLFAATGVAVGLGSLAPKFQRNEYLNVERAQPSQPALFGYFFAGTVGFSIVPGVLWLWATDTLATVPTGVGLAVYLAVLTGLGVAGYAYARYTFDGLSMDRV